MVSEASLTSSIPFLPHSPLIRTYLNIITPVFGVASTNWLGRPAGWMTHSLTHSHSLFVRMQEILESASSHARQDLRVENCNTWMGMVKRGDRGQDKDERGVRGRQTGRTHGLSFYCEHCSKLRAWPVNSSAAFHLRTDTSHAAITWTPCTLSTRKIYSIPPAIIIEINK